MNYKNLIQIWENEADIQDEWLFERLRIWRDRELAQSDWTQVADSTADKTAWATYRQALRDLPSQNADPKKIVFPSRPA
jgi:hypothetical protein